MLRKFKITIDGTEYLVEMEEIGGTPAPAVPVATSAPQPTPVTPAAPQNAAGDTLPAPMPGSILKLLVKVGDEVKENQPLIILEAMKMENEVVSNHAGKVTGINVTVGENVNAGDALITIQ